jgi:hypothetical protein
MTTIAYSLLLVAHLLLGISPERMRMAYSRAYAKWVDLEIDRLRAEKLENNRKLRVLDKIMEDIKKDGDGPRPHKPAGKRSAPPRPGREGQAGAMLPTTLRQKL